MRFPRLALAHARIAGRQRALWVVSALLALLSLSVMVNSAMPFETGNASDLAFLAQMLAFLPPLACAAACTDLASAPSRLGVGEIEDAAPVAAVTLTAARVAGAFAVLALPSFALLLFCGFGQLAHGNPWGPLQAATLFASVAAPAALLAMALSALVGTVLPKALARIVAAVGWLAALVPLSFVGEPTAGGGIQFHIAADSVCQAFFGCPPLLDAVSAAAPATPLVAIALLVTKLALVAGLLVVASVIARHRSFKRG